MYSCARCPPKTPRRNPILLKSGESVGDQWSRNSASGCIFTLDVRVSQLMCLGDPHATCISAVTWRIIL
ncbi:hypothetical protein DPEC_G00050750 [Dallia pectoralis]|uniref:Uncharacterized protein n=1 Tax=Dallia pectoralis TaxID=75939 RepID=A0ACC2HBY1_DALPE|nr:hypothetical protein DPEC_G00050750 [Dallia pectoralis]